MKLIRKTCRPYGLKARFAISLAIYGIICVAFFGVLILIGETLIDSYFEDPAVTAKITKKKAAELQQFVDSKQLDSTDLTDLKKWEKKQSLILLDLFDGNQVVYSSFYDAKDQTGDYWVPDAEFSDRSNVFTIRFRDKPLTAILYIVTAHYYLLCDTLALAAAMFLFILLYTRSNRSLINYVLRLGEDVQILEGGDLNYEVTVKGNDELTDLAKSLNRMRESFREQMIAEQRLHQTNRKLTSEMSHDLRTPLTSLMLYTEILRFHQYENEEQMEDYLAKIDSKAHLIKLLSDHLFEHSLDPDRTYGITSVDFHQSISGMLADAISELESAGFSIEQNLDWQPVQIMFRPELFPRILENITSNIIKYASCDAPVYVQTSYSDEYCTLSFLNAASNTRPSGDSHGIGLESIRSIMEQMEGKCIAEQTEDAFECLLLFKTA